MGRPTVGTVARSVVITMRATPALRRMIDQRRGELSVSEYLRKLVVADARRSDKTG